MKAKAKAVNNNLETTLNNYLKEITEAKGFRSLDAYRWYDGTRIHTRTYGQLNADSRRIASYLNMRFGRGRHIALFGETSYAWMTAYFGIMVSGNISVPMDIKLDMDRAAARLERADVTVLLLSGRFMHLSGELREKCPYLKAILNMDELSALARNCNESFETEIDSSALAQLMITSGTTKEGKIVMLSHNNIYSVTHGNIHLCNPGERVLSILPIYHCFELFFTQLSYLLQGATICINSDISNIVSDMRLFEVNYIITVPLIVNQFAQIIKNITNKSVLNRDQIIAYFGGHLKKIGIGGAAVRPKVIDALRSAGIHVFYGYGLTESAGGCTVNADPIDDSVGKPFIDGLETAIIDGELCLRGPNTMLGYYKDKETTEKTIIDGWLHTGDLGYVNKYGCVHLYGRKDNLIVSYGGENVYPEEIEEDIKSIPGVVEAVVYKAANFLHAGIQLEEPEKEDHVRREINALNQRLPSYKAIVRLVFPASAFPVTTSMKVKRNDAIRILLDQERDEDRKRDEEAAQKIRSLNSPEIQVICNAFAQALGKNEFSEDANFFDCGGDSLAVLTAAYLLNSSDTFENVTPEIIFRHPIPELLYEHLYGNPEKPVTEKIPGINNLISSHSRMPAGLGKNIFITGASGFLGNHVLRELVRKGYNITCLIRDKIKFSNACNFYFPDKDFPNVRLITGDIRRDNLGLSKAQYLELASWTDSVFHIAADVRHLAPENELEKTNVKGTENVIAFSIRAKAKLFHSSTFSVSGFHSTEVLDEGTLDIGQEISQNSYIRTKYRAEEAVLKARNAIHTCILRMGFLTRRSDGVFQYNDQENGLESQLKAFRKLGVCPSELSDLSYDFSSVDESAEAFVLLAETSSEDSIWHVINPNRQTLSQLRLADPVPMDTFSRKVALMSEDRDVMVLSMYLQMIEQGINHRVDCSKTVERLKELGFEWSDPSSSKAVEKKAC